MRQLQSARDIYLMNNKHSQIQEENDEDSNDEEMIYKPRRKQRPHAQTERRGRSANQESLERQSVIEKAISKTSTFVMSIGGFLKGGYEKIKDYVFQEDTRDPALVQKIRAKSARSQSRNKDQLSDSSEYATPRGKSQTSRQKSQSRKYGKNQVVPQLIIEQNRLSNSSQEDRQYRVHKQTIRIQPIQEELNHEFINRDQKSKDKSQNKSTNSQKVEDKSSSQNKTTKSISIQAESKKERKQLINPVQQQQVINKQASNASLKSIGVGSLNINESSHTPSIYSNQSQKLQHSRMIQIEKKKRLGNKSKMLIQKNYQSSEDERKHQNTNDRSPSPAPRFMKEEIAYYKQQKMIEQNANLMQQAFQQKDIKEEFNQQQKTQIPQSIVSTPNQRNLNLKNSQQLSLGTGQNQRYVRNISNSPSGPEVQQIATDSNTPLRTQSENIFNKEKGLQAQNMLTQEQFDMIMLNSEGEGAQNSNKHQKQMPTNNHYKIIDSDKDTKKTKEFIKKSDQPKILQQVTINKKSEDIKKFYEDLVQNASLTQIEETKNENASESINDTNLSNLYQRVMNKQSKKEQIKHTPKQEQQIEVIPFNPDENVFPLDDGYCIDFNDFDNQLSIDLVRSIIRDFEENEHLSICSFIDQAPLQLSTQMQSNVLDRGQFVGNSCISMHGTNQNTNSSTIQRPLIIGMQNNSMQNFNIQYQSDAESDYANKKRGKLGKLNAVPLLDATPLKKKPMLIPPLNQKYMQNLNLVQPVESDNSARVVIQNQPQLDSSLSTIILKQNTSKEQKLIIELFKEDEEQERLIHNEKQPLSGNFMQTQQSLADELKNTFNDLEVEFIRQESYNHKKKHSDQEYVNIINNDSDEFLTQSEDSGMKRQFQERLLQKLNEIDQKLKDDSPKIINKQLMSMDSKQKSLQEDSKVYSNNQSKPSRKNNRYETEDSLINFDVSHSKLDQTDKILSNQMNEDDEQSKPDSRQTLKTQIKQQIQSYVKQQQPQIKQKPKPKVEVVVLPLNILSPAYKQSEIQSWTSESHSLIDKDQLQKALLGNMMVQAFSTSELKYLKRQYLPYHGATSTTQMIQQDTIATATGNINRQVTNQTIQVLRQSVQSLRKSSNQGLTVQSQDSIVQELDSISRIYDDLETVQEEEAGLTYDKTNTLEESKIDSNLLSKPSRKIPKQQSNRYGAASNSDDKNSDTPVGQQPIIQQIFYKQEGLKYLGNINTQCSNVSQNQGGGEQDEQASTYAPNYWQWKREEKQNRSTTTTLLYNMQTSSEDESKRKANNLFANVRPRIKQQNLLHSSVNAPLYQHGQTTAIKRSIKDVSFKSNNISTHTEGSERLKENLKMFQKNRMLGNRKKSQDKKIQEQTLEESIK